MKFLIRLFITFFVILNWQFSFSAGGGHVLVKPTYTFEGFRCQNNFDNATGVVYEASSDSAIDWKEKIKKEGGDKCELTMLGLITQVHYMRITGDSSRGGSSDPSKVTGKHHKKVGVVDAQLVDFVKQMVSVTFVVGERERTVEGVLSDQLSAEGKPMVYVVSENEGCKTEEVDGVDGKKYKVFDSNGLSFISGQILDVRRKSQDLFVLRGQEWVLALPHTTFELPVVDDFKLQGDIQEGLYLQAATKYSLESLERKEDGDNGKCMLSGVLKLQTTVKNEGVYGLSNSRRLD